MTGSQHQDHESTTGARAWSSDIIAEAVRATGVSHIALTPGASFRGLHDSLVNHLGDTRPTMLTCLHEEHAVAVAHGYAKVAESPMAVALHSNVGVLHGAMAVFNAYADRVPMLIIGADGPSDAARRRPWIDWLHTVSDLGAVLRDFVKWDDRAESAHAAVEAIARANQLTRAAPTAPVFVALDVAAQEELVAPPSFSVDDVASLGALRPDEADIERASGLLRADRRCVILAGRVSRSPAAWQERVALAESLGAHVITNHKLGAAFPTTHSLHSGAPARFLSQRNRELIRDADVIISLDWLDLAGTLRQACDERRPSAAVIQVSPDHQLFTGATKLHFSTPPVNVHLPCSPDAAVPELLRAIGAGRSAPRNGDGPLVRRSSTGPRKSPHTRLDNADIQVALWKALNGRPRSLLRVPFGWDFSEWPLEDPLDYLGAEGGGGVGAGPGMSVGSALALQGSGRLPITVLGDGDFLMGSSALWTAARYNIPLLVIVSNNSSYYNDEQHQVTVAKRRDRPEERAHIGVRIDDPEPDVAGLARAYGCEGIGPVSTRTELAAALDRGIGIIEQGGRAVLDVRVARGYGAVDEVGWIRVTGQVER